MTRRPRLTIRARLTLIYVALSAACGAVIVAVSYALVARLGVAQARAPSTLSAVPASLAVKCKIAYLRGDKRFVGAKCPWSVLAGLGAQAERHLTLTRLLQYSLITLSVVIAFAAILGWIFSGRALRPVHRITAAARAASQHNLSARIAPGGPRDEVRELAETFDDMLGRLQTAFEAQEQFIANASHELRTPLAVMGTTIDVVVDNPASTTGELRAMAADIRAAVDHAEHLIGALLLLARNGGGLTVHEQIDLGTVARDVLHTAGLSGLQVHAMLQPAFISGDPVLAERLVANLVDNAARYNLAAGDIWISTRTVAGNSRLTVANTGPVISPADADRIFQPFQRLNNRTSHDGFGLGLAIVVSIAETHGGTIIARPRRKGGLTVSVTIPSAGAPSRDTDIQARLRPDVPLLR